MKSMKAKLISAIAMLLVATIMMTSASFAWFTLSTKGEMKNVEISMGTTYNLEIAKAKTGAAGEVGEVTGHDTGDDYTWGSSVSSFTGAAVQYPAVYDGTNWKTMIYGADYRTSSSDGQTLTVAAPEISSGVSIYKANINREQGNDPVEKVIAAGYSIWIRSNQDLNDVKVEVTGGAFTGPSMVNRPAAYALTADDVSVSVKVSGGATVANGGTFELTANEPKLVTVLVSVKGDNIIASDVTSGAGLKIEGINVKFTSETVTNKEPAVVVPAP